MSEDQNNPVESNDVISTPEDKIIYESSGDSAIDDAWNEIMGDTESEPVAEDEVAEEVEEHKSVAEEVFEEAAAEEELEDDSEAIDDVEEDEEFNGEGEEQVDSEAHKVIAFKTLAGDQLEVPADATIVLPVDGVDQEISLQDFANGISGQRAISQKFTALDQERKAFENRLNNYRENEQQVRDLMSSNKVVEAMQVIFEKAGYSPEAAFAQFFTQITPVLDQYASLNDTDRENWRSQLNQRRAEYQTKAAQNEVQRLQAEKDQEVRVRRVQSELGLDDASFMDYYHKLEGEMQKGTLQQQAITPELVGQYAQLAQKSEWAAEALKGTKLEGSSEAVDHVLVAVNQLAREGTAVTKEVVIDLVRRAYGDPDLEKAKKVNKALEKKGVKPRLAQQKTGQKKKVISRKKEGGSAPKGWMDSVLEDLEAGAKLEDVGLQSKRRN